jgi:DNA-binding MarR family transcriptional regulator
MADQRPIGYWLKLVDKLIEAQFATTLDEHGVTRTQWQLMNVLARQPASVEQLTASVAPFLDTGETAAEHLAELIDSEWVDSEQSAYRLTERGTAALERLTVVVTAQRATMAEGMTAEQYDVTVTVLEKMARNLGWTEPQAEAPTPR